MASKHKQMGPLMFILLDEHFQKLFYTEQTLTFAKFKLNNSETYLYTQACWF